MKKNNRLMYRNNRLFFWWLYQFSFCCFCCLILMYSKQLSCFISSLCLFVKTNRGRYMLCLISVFISAKQFGWVKPYRILLLYLFVDYYDIMLWIPILVFVLIKYQKFYALLKTMLCRNCFRFNQVQHKHQGYFWKYKKLWSGRRRYGVDRQFFITNFN